MIKLEEKSDPSPFHPYWIQSVRSGKQYLNTDSMFMPGIEVFSHKVSGLDGLVFGRRVTAAGLHKSVSITGCQAAGQGVVFKHNAAR